MTTWILLASILMVTTVSAVFLSFLYLRQTKTYELIESTAQLLADLANSLGPAIVDLQQSAGRIEAALEELPRRVVPLLEKASREQLWTGGFLPTDEMQANLERVIKASEDQAISATGEHRYSPLRSSSSGTRSDRGSSSRAARRSGNR